MRRVRAIAAVLMLLSIGIVAAGCGDRVDGTPTGKDPVSRPSGNSIRYEAELREMHSDMNDAMSRAFSTRDLDPKAVRTARDTAWDAVDWMEDTDPPKRFAPAHAEYQEGLKTFAEILESVEQQIAEPDVARQHLQDTRFSTGVEHLDRASNLYEQAGLVLDESAAA